MISHLFSRYMIEKITTQPTPTIRKEKCINQLQKRQSCHQCQEICPHQAIDLQLPAMIQTELCQNCGMCASHCRTGSIVQSLELVKSQYQSLNNDHEVVISCYLDEEQTGLKVECLAALPWEFYVYASLKQHVIMMTKKCETCSNERLREQVRQTMNQVNRFLGETLFHEKIEVMSHEIEREQPTYSRRDLLKLWAQESKRLVGEAIPIASDVNQNARIYRQMLINQLNHAEEKILEKLNFAWCGIKVTDSCYGCGVCETICPQKAISISKNESGERIFKHHYLKCTHCGLCQTVCLDQAINLDYVHAFEIDGYREQAISSHECLVCHDPIPFSEGEICIICQRQQD